MSPQRHDPMTPGTRVPPRRPGGATARSVVEPGRLSRSADVVLARLIADEASFARRVRRANDHRVVATPAPLLANEDVDADQLA